VARATSGAAGGARSVARAQGPGGYVVIVGILPDRETHAHDAARMGAARRSTHHPPDTSRALADGKARNAPRPARAIPPSAKRARPAQVARRPGSTPRRASSTAGLIRHGRPRRKRAQMRRASTHGMRGVRARFALVEIARAGRGDFVEPLVRAAAGDRRRVARGASRSAHAGRVVRVGFAVRKNPHDHHITPRSLGAATFRAPPAAHRRRACVTRPSAQCATRSRAGEDPVPLPQHPAHRGMDRRRRPGERFRVRGRLSLSIGSGPRTAGR
jgi:hypothetical protein